MRISCFKAYKFIIQYKVNNKVTPSPKDIIVIGVMLFACVIFFTDVLREILELV